MPKAVAMKKARKKYGPMKHKTPGKKRKIEETMREYGVGMLRSGSKTGPTVKNRKQAVAIALSQARRKKSGSHKHAHGLNVASRRRNKAAHRRSRNIGRS